MTQDEINIEIIKKMQSDVRYLMTENGRDYSDFLALRSRVTSAESRLSAFDNLLMGIRHKVAILALLVLLVLGGIGLVSIFATPCKADETQPNWKVGSYQLLDVDKVSFEYAKIRNQRDGFYVIDDENFDYRMAFLLDFKVLEILYWKNDVHMMAASDHVRAVGWQYEGGMHIFKNADVFWFHHSQHVLEREPPVGQSNPLENRYGFRINFINK